MAMAYEGPALPNHNQVPGYPEGLPQPGTFNLAALSDDRAVRLGLGLYHEILRPGIGSDAQHDAEMLFQCFSADLAHLAMTEPDRGRPLLMRLAQNDDADERWLAIESAVPLCVQDYEFASDMFLTAAATIRKAVKLKRTDSFELDNITAGMSAMSDFLSPEQARDLYQREYERWPEEG